jgi:hypothetical protein
MIMKFCCGSALEAQRSGTRAAASTTKQIKANQSKRLAFARATCDG